MDAVFPLWKTAQDVLNPGAQLESQEAVQLTDRLHAEQGKGDPFAAAVRATRMPMIITDPRQDDNPIVFTNDAFLRLTGYTRDEVMGFNCRFLQGLGTDPREVEKLRIAVRDQTDIHVELLNYRKDGSTSGTRCISARCSDTAATCSSSLPRNWT